MKKNKRMVTGIVIGLIDFVGFAKSSNDLTALFQTGQISQLNYETMIKEGIWIWGIIFLIGLFFFLWGLLDRKRG